jgi:hypothetical protein
MSLFTETGSIDEIDEFEMIADFRNMVSGEAEYFTFFIWGNGYQPTQLIISYGKEGSQKKLALQSSDLQEWYLVPQDIVSPYLRITWDGSTLSWYDENNTLIDQLQQGEIVKPYSAKVCLAQYSIWTNEPADLTGSTYYSLNDTSPTPPTPPLPPPYTATLSYQDLQNTQGEETLLYTETGQIQKMTSGCIIGDFKDLKPSGDLDFGLGLYSNPMNIGWYDSMIFFDFVVYENSIFFVVSISKMLPPNIWQNQMMTYIIGEGIPSAYITIKFDASQAQIYDENNTLLDTVLIENLTPEICIYYANPGGD